MKTDRRGGRQEWVATAFAGLLFVFAFPAVAEDPEVGGNPPPIEGSAYQRHPPLGVVPDYLGKIEQRAERSVRALSPHLWVDGVLCAVVGGFFVGTGIYALPISGGWGLAAMTLGAGPLVVSAAVFKQRGRMNARLAGLKGAGIQSPIDADFKQKEALSLIEDSRNLERSLRVTEAIALGYVGAIVVSAGLNSNSSYWSSPTTNWTLLGIGAGMGALAVFRLLWKATPESEWEAQQGEGGIHLESFLLPDLQRQGAIAGLSIRF